MFRRSSILLIVSNKLIHGFRRISILLAYSIQYGRPKILTLNGLSMSDFDTQEKALATADALVLQNKEEFGHPGTSRLHENPLLSKYWYIVSGGRSHTFTRGEKERLLQNSDDSKAIEKHFAVTDTSGDTGGGDVRIKIENASWAPFYKNLKEAQGSLKLMKAALNKTDGLSLQFLVAGRKDNVLKEHHTSLEKKCKSFGDHISALELKVAECSLLTATEEAENLDKVSAELQQLVCVGGAHKDGHADVYKRYREILEGKRAMDPTTLVKSMPAHIVEGMED